MPKIVIAIVFCVVPALAAAQQQVFRYVDKNGRVVYTDTAPPTGASSIQQKKLGGNFIETSEPSYALQSAQKRNPVTLYSGDCGTSCEQARALLNRRGVPHRDINPSTPEEAEKMKQITGDLQVPVLVVGSATMLKGFDEASWQAALDQASYPKTPSRRVTALRLEADGAVVDKATAKSAGKNETRTAVKEDGQSEDKRDAKGGAPPTATTGSKY